MSPLRSRIEYGRLVHAFIRAGWNPPRPSDRITHAIVDDIARVQPQAKLGLAKREKEVVQLMADGFTYQDIASELGISHGTVRQSQKRAFRRLGARNAAHAVAIGYRLGIIE